MKPEYKKITLTIIAIVLLAIVASYVVAKIRLKSVFGDLPPYQGQKIEYTGPGDEFTNKLPQDALEKRAQELKELKKRIYQNPKDYNLWIQAGILKKFFNNYEGARDVWEYAAVVDPTISTAYFNLGNLYATYLKDFPKAELNYQKAVEIEGRVSSQYHIAFADFYDYVYVEKRGEVEKVLLNGIALMPSDASLKVRVAEYYEKNGDLLKAIQYLKAAIENDPSLLEVRKKIQTLESRLR